MKSSAIWHEVKRGLSSGTSRGLLFGLLLAMLVVSLGLAELFQVRAITHNAAQYRAAGGSVTILSAPELVDAGSCEALRSVPGINASGALKESEERLSIVTLLGAPVPVSVVTPGFPALLGVDEAAPGVILSDQVANPLGVLTGDSVETMQGPATVAGTYTYPNDGRKPGYGYMILVPTVERSNFDECWVEIWPQSDELEGLVYTALVPGADTSTESVQLGQLNASMGKHYQGAGLYKERLTRWAPLVALAVATGLGLVAVFRRRLELASALHAGVKRLDMSLIVTLETAVWAASALLGALAVLTIGAVSLSSDNLALLLHLSGRVAFGGAVGIALGTFMALVSIREKHLFRYFKLR